MKSTPPTAAGSGTPATYEAAFAEGREPKKLDKEYLRSWLAGQGFTGEGPVPPIPPEVFSETRNRYVEAFERITDGNSPFPAKPLKRKPSGSCLR